jgi:pimeloyl-ACP methyl ester carboxylesterase
MGYRQHHYSAQDGLRLAWREYGDGGAPRPAVLCLPGLTRNARDFHGLAGRIAGRHRVLCPDYRGRGASARDSDWRNYTPSRYVDDLRHLLALANCHRVVVIGTSLGGLLAMALAVVMPGALAGVVLNDIGPDIEAAGLAGIVAHVSENRTQPDLESAAAALESRFPDLSRRDPSVWRRLAENTYRRGEDGRLHRDWDPAIGRAFAHPPEAPRDLWPLFGALAAIPTLALRGAISPILSQRGLAAMRAARPDLETLTIDDTGHAPTLDEPEAVAAIDAFLARV